MKHAITLRIDNDLLRSARLHAQAENRTLTNLVETVLKRHIAGASNAPADGQTAAGEAATSSARPAAKRTASRKAHHG